MKAGLRGGKVMSEYTIDISMGVETCFKGHIYCVPNWAHVSAYQCPMCAVDNAERKNDRIERLENQIRGLKGEITKLKNEDGK